MAIEVPTLSNKFDKEMHKLFIMEYSGKVECSICPICKDNSDVLVVKDTKQTRKYECTGCNITYTINYRSNRRGWT